jgi:nudix motif 8
MEALVKILKPFLRSNTMRRNEKNEFDVSKEFTRRELTMIQRQLHRMPREVFQASTKRASVVIPLVNDNGEAAVLFTRRSGKMRTHKHEVCFPGGMVDDTDDNIVQTSLREMEEELGIPSDNAEVLGVLRCQWDEVSNIMSGIAVTPVVAYLGDMDDLSGIITTNPDEVEEWFCVPLEKIMDGKHWVIRNYATPMFTGGPHVVWGLTAYLLDKFVKDVIVKCQQPFTPL